MIMSVLFLCVLLVFSAMSSVHTSENSTAYPIPAFKLDMFQKAGISTNNRRKLLDNEPEISPLFEGMGTHYSFIWVGTPPQRVSVIVDTGSHHTAFPCVGCKCGKHMDPYFDPVKSSTSAVKDCGSKNGGNIKNNKCFFRQSYSEGSSWNAFKVKDKVWMGGPMITDNQRARNWSVNFEFGCQESETGLFRTQNVDGIMGMSAAEDTLPYQLFAHKVTSTKVFAMCFKTGGGVLTLGGVDPSLHGRAVTTGQAAPGGTELQFARLLKPKGWFTVKLLDVLMRHPGDGSLKSIGGSIFKFNTGKGTIVDSGTTDTYLPSAALGGFRTLFQSISGMQHSNNVVEMSPAQFARLPTIVYRLEGLTEGSTIEIEVPPSSYVEAFKGGRYASRVYLTEASGAVLGANFMNGHNVVFDIEQLRVGFVQSDCVYKAVTHVTSALSVAKSFGSAVAGRITAHTNKTDLSKVANLAQLRASLKLQDVDSLLPH